MTEPNPPLLQHYGALFRPPVEVPPALEFDERQNAPVMEECQLPLIDLTALIKHHNERERLACSTAICRASSEWGFFQVVNHGISPELLGTMKKEQLKLFQTPFERKASCGLLNNSYRWGTPTATYPKQFSWSEAFHVPLTKISEEDCYGEFSSLREVIKEFAAAMSELAKLLAGILAENLGHQKGVFEDICDESTCFIRLNRYPACPISPEMFGLVPHTDSDFLTILYQDQVGGLQLMKDSKWVAVKPNQDALIVNIGDLFQINTLSQAPQPSKPTSTTDLRQHSITSTKTVKTHKHRSTCSGGDGYGDEIASPIHDTRSPINDPQATIHNQSTTSTVPIDPQPQVHKNVLSVSVGVSVCGCGCV